MRLRPCPFTLIIGPPCPPALPGQAVTFTHHKHRERRCAVFGGDLVYLIQRLAYRPHFRPREAETKVQQKLGIADRTAFTPTLLQYGLDPRNIVQRRNIRRRVAQKLFKDRVQVKS